MEDLIRTLTPQLFWDVDPQNIDIKKHASWLIVRVLQRGTWEDWLLICSFYGKKTIGELAPALKLDRKSAHFLKLYCQI